ncbi:MAG TPA: MFS transporter, partial [Solirubrobacterales bacterium]|nr:MFS transporter [Solirubrobacterales bacterium]
MPVAVGPSWLDPESLIRTFGMLGVLAIVYMESGLMVGFFLPGDSLLFTAGLLSANDVLPDIWVLLVTIPIAAIAGDQTGYWIGRKFGPPLFNRPDSRFFKREYVDQTAAFFEKHGPRAIILARFVPIVRAFVPVMAGTSHMHYRTFLVYDIVGGILFGAITDRIGRTRTLLLTMALYSLGTAACALAPNIWVLIACRVVASLGIGGEWAAGASMVAEVVPEHRRVEAGALLYTSAPLGLFLATFVDWYIAGHLLLDDPASSWRYVFLCGLIPSAVAFLVRLFVKEPERWHDATKDQAPPTLADLFTPGMARITLGGLAMAVVALLTWWSCNAFIAMVATGLATKHAHAVG